MQNAKPQEILFVNGLSPCLQQEIDMRIICIFIPFVLLSLLFAEKPEKKHNHFNTKPKCFEQMDVDIDNDIIVLTCKYDDSQWVEITPEYQLYVNGMYIGLTRYERRLIAEYYDSFMDIIDQAKEIGKEGAIIGVKGAKIGVIAAAGALKMILSDYDSDNLEDDLEDQTIILEERAEKLEEMAEDLEESADEFEELHYSLKEKISDLNQLEWF
jgi:hypothetical protein